MKGFLAFLLLLFIIWGVRKVFSKFLPLLFPRGGFRTWLATWLIPSFGALLFGITFAVFDILKQIEISWLNPLGAIIGAFLSLLSYGIYPFVKIFIKG